MSRIEAVTFSEFYLFEESQHNFTYPANDPLPLYGMPFQANERDPVESVDTLGTTNPGHLYSAPTAACYVGWGRWDITQVMVTNANPFLVYWCLYKFPPSSYKDQTDSQHKFWRYNPSGQQATDQLDIRLYALFYAQPLAPNQTFVTPTGWRAIGQPGESLWGCCNPGWLWSGRNPVAHALPPSLPATNATTMRVTGDIVV